MEINRSNYEIWIIDMLDGNLDQLQAEQVRLFLDRNPDLKEEIDELNLTTLFVPADKFPNIRNLRKSIDDIPDSQFEYLCAASLENDLSGDGLAEFEGIIERDSSKGEVYDLFRKTKLVPVNAVFKHKGRLLKGTSSRKVITSYSAWLTAAAAIGLLFVYYILVPRSLPDNPEKTALNLQVKDNGIRYIEISSSEGIRKAPDNKIKSGDAVTSSKVAVPSKPKANTGPSVEQEVPVREDAIVVSDIQVKNIAPDFGLKENLPSPGLAVSNIQFNPPAGQTVISRANKLLAKVFREKLLKEDVPEETPLKGYEIAEAGVNGINRLFGWEMSLNEKKDTDGELKSVYFSSRILKFNAPVKKAQTAQ
jgi:hypothetical protein